MWIGMMEGSRKATDIARDDRFALHAASIDKDVADGDAKVAGRAVPATPADRQRYVEAVKAAGGWIPPGEFPLFMADLTEVSFIRVEGGDHLLIELWKPGQDVQQIERR